MRRSLFAGLTLWATVVVPGAAHHSAAAVYVMTQQITIDGVVTKYGFVNPHARVYLDVSKPDGAVEQWMAEGGSPIVLRRQGWNGQELKPGDRVKITGNPARDGSRLIHWLTIRLPNGSDLYGEDIDFGAIDKLRQQRRN